MMYKKRAFLFKCEECQMIVSLEFDDQEDIDKIQNDQIVFECPCGSCYKILRD